MDSGDWKVSELESVRIRKCQNWNVSESESVRIGKCQNWKVSELFFFSGEKRPKQMKRRWPYLAVSSIVSLDLAFFRLVKNLDLL